MSIFPIIRPRRLRENKKLREIVQENSLEIKSLIQPLFVKKGHSIREEISSMPGQFRFSPDLLIKEVEELNNLGIRSILLFGIIDSSEKDAQASQAYADSNPVIQAIQLIKKKFPEMLIIADVCLCDYSDHGHCGLIKEVEELKSIDNDSSLEVLSKISAAYARAGADIIAPSDMMDGRVAAIRDELDAIGHKNTPILSYAVKYASSFYGPFRDALQSSPSFGDRRSYQMDPANSREAIKELEQDLAEGADLVMVKPGLPYLDIIFQVKEQCQVPVVAYQVSGEYAMIQAAVEKGWLDQKSAMQESLLCLKRAGADLIVTYFAKEMATLV